MAWIVNWNKKYISLLKVRSTKLNSRMLKSTAEKRKKQSNPTGNLVLGWLKFSSGMTEVKLRSIESWMGRPKLSTEVLEHIRIPKTQRNYLNSYALWKNSSMTTKHKLRLTEIQECTIEVQAQPNSKKHSRSLKTK